MALSLSRNFAAVGLKCHAHEPKRKTAIYSTAGPVCITSPNKTAAACWHGLRSAGVPMANGRNTKRKGHDTSRDQGGFIAVPWSVLDCPAYARLSHPAKALLFEVARQFVRDNNGRMLLSRAHMAKRGWKSADTISNAKRELLASGFIHETVAGHRPNKASWYAVTWRSLDKISGYDPGAVETFKRGTYQQNMPIKNASLSPPAGTGRAVIVPPAGTETLPTVPPAGTMKAVLRRQSVPPAGHHLDMPSIAVCLPDFLVVPAVQNPETKMALFDCGTYKRLTAKPAHLFTNLIQ
jgi:hypothetical protein